MVATSADPQKIWYTRVSSEDQIRSIFYVNPTTPHDEGATTDQTAEAAVCLYACNSDVVQTFGVTTVVSVFRPFSHSDLAEWYVRAKSGSIRLLKCISLWR